MVPFWSDKVEIDHIAGPGLSQKISVTFEEFRQALLNDPYGPQEVRLSGLVDCTGLNAKFTKLRTIPKGSLITFAGLIIVEEVVAGGTTVKLGLGLHGSTPSVFGLSDDLLANTQFQSLLNGDPLADDTDVDLCGVVTDGSALGDSNITAGKVFVSLQYKALGQFSPIG